MDRAARKKLFDENKRFALFLAEKELKKRPDPDGSDDIRQEALLAMWAATEAYDEKRNVKFTTYAAPYITGAIHKAQWRAETPFSASASTVRNAARDEEGKKQYRNLQNKVISLNAARGTDEDTSLLDMIPDKTTEENADMTARPIPEIFYKTLQSALTDTQWEIFREFFGLGCPRKTSGEIARETGTTTRYVDKCLHEQRDGRVTGALMLRITEIAQKCGIGKEAA